MVRELTNALNLRSKSKPTNEILMAESDEFSRENFFSMIEKAFKPQIFLLAVGFGLFMDSTLVYFCGGGIRDVETGGNALSVSLAIKVTLAFIAFSGVVSMAMPFVDGTARQIYLEVLFKIQSALHNLKVLFWGSEDEPRPPRQREHNCVRPGELKLEAHETHSDFLMGVYSEYRRPRKHAESQGRKTAFYAFCALVFMAFNYWLPGASGELTVTRWFAPEFMTAWQIWFGFTVFAVLAFAPLHVDDWGKQWIYCPPLYRKLEAKDEEEREKERKWRTELERNVAQARYEREAQER